MKAFFLLLLLGFSFDSVLAADPYNTYRYNRKNAVEGNGKLEEKPWFEWWYYKVVLPETSRSFYFIYGVVNPWDFTGRMKGTQAYVEAGDFTTRKINTELYPLNDFQASYVSTEIKVGTNQASDLNIQGQVKGKDGDVIRWDIDYEKKWAHNAEAWLLGTDLTGIEWYPAQADARCTGEVESGGELIKFTDAPCYQDRNWGRIFPKWWAWIVSNHFENSPGTALAIGGGKPTVLGTRVAPLESVSIGFRHQGKVYDFRPNTFDLVKVDINFGKWEVMAMDPTTRIEVSATAPKETFMDLIFTSPQGQKFHDYETLTGKVRVKLWKKNILPLSRWVLKADVTSNAAGIEYGSHDLEAFDKIFTEEKSLLLP